jgi:hypothetical protein
MWFDPTVDMRYRFPCRNKLPDVVAHGLSAWFLTLTAHEPREVLRVLGERWSGPSWLRPLANAVADFGQPALVVGYRQAYVELSPGKARFEVPWTPRPWLPSPWAFDPAAARRFLVGEGQDRALEMDDDALEHEARDEWIRLNDDGTVDREDDEDESLFVTAPVRSEEVQARLARLGASGNGALVELVTAVAGLKESEPGTAGSFMTVEELDLAGADCPDPAWKAALQIFYARNGDRVIVDPGSGEVAWWVFAEMRVEPRWKGIQEFVHAYASNLEARWPFDSYGPPRT